MTLQEIAMQWLNNDKFWMVLLCVVLTLVEITPIKINPWSWIAKKIGSAFNGEVMKEISHLKQEIKSVKDDVSDIREEAKEREATNRRTRILEFGDEILHGINYSKEHFDNVLMDISAYENYCDDHPHYMNHVAKATIKHIKEVYQEHLKNDSFLK